MATRELARLGPVVEPDLRQALGGDLSPERRYRVERLLGLWTLPVRSPDRLRELRAVAVLEYAATRQARQLLRELAAGEPGSWLTREAKAALARLEKRTTDKR
jgi:hypothetical protein